MVSKLVRRSVNIIILALFLSVFSSGVFLSVDWIGAEVGAPAQSPDDNAYLELSVDPAQSPAGSLVTLHISYHNIGLPYTTINANPSNLVDFERTIRSLYKEHQELSKGFKKYENNYEFAKYLRNKFVGHIHTELIEKAIEWKPELRIMANKMENQKLMTVTNIFVLETAINTFVDAEEKNKFFETETDLMYPPDWKRFLDFLEVSVL